jgi:hypothetical protein
MHNPLVLFSTELLNSLIKTGHAYFVRQTYKRGVDHFGEKQKGPYLLSHYTDISKATMHYESLNMDANRFLYDISKQEHLEKLKVAAGQPQGYKIYIALLQKEWTPSDIMKGKVRRYVDQKLKWHPGRNETVKTNLFIQFGELFITLKLGIREIKVPLSDIERL